MAASLDLQHVSKYLAEYSNVLHAEAIRFANLGIPHENVLFRKSKMIKCLAEDVLLISLNTRRPALHKIQKPFNNKLFTSAGSKS